MENLQYNARFISFLGGCGGSANKCDKYQPVAQGSKLHVYMYNKVIILLAGTKLAKFAFAFEGKFSQI